jgi:hypothetical protein
LAIWTSAAQVMGKRKARSQTGIKLAIWLPTTKIRESTSSRRHQRECDTALESSQRELQLWFKPCPDLSSGREVMVPQSPGSPNQDSFGTISGLHLGSPEKKSHLDVASVRSCREYYKGEGGGFPQVRAVVSQVSPNARGLSQHPRVFPNAN